MQRVISADVELAPIVAFKQAMACETDAARQNFW